MPLYPYRCQRGHDWDEFFHMKDEKPATISCPSCGASGRRLVVVANIAPDIPEHFNMTIGQPVRSRKHLRELQRANGWQDYEPDSAARKRHAPPDARQLAAIREAERLGAERSATVFKDDPEVSVLEPME